VTRLHDVSSGAVFLDGADLRTLPVADLRARVGVVSQDTTLFDNTVAYNIR
jgi:ABC-type multidrug transport system fused ATPase/permease subunit